MMFFFAALLTSLAHAAETCWDIEGTLSINFPQDYPVTGEICGGDGTFAGTLEVIGLDTSLELILEGTNDGEGIDPSLSAGSLKGTGSCAASGAAPLEIDCDLVLKKGTRSMDVVLELDAWKAE